MKEGNERKGKERKGKERKGKGKEGVGGIGAIGAGGPSTPRLRDTFCKLCRFSAQTTSTANPQRNLAVWAAVDAERQE